MRLVLIAVFYFGFNFDWTAGAQTLLAETTLPYHLATNAVARTNGFTGSYDDLYELSAPASTNLDRLTRAVWSTRFWLKGVQGLSATPIGFSNVLGGHSLPTMVSPRHYLCASHMHPEQYMLAFLDTNNTLYWRKTLQRLEVTNDTAIGILDADLPASVGFLPVLPPNFATYLPTSASSCVQGIGMNQDLRLFSQPMNFGNAPLVVWNSKVPIPFGLPPKWSLLLRSGDSSNPARLLIGNQLVLVAHNTAVSAGFNYAYQLDAINHKMHDLSTHNRVRSDYQLTLFPLTNWPVFKN